MSCESADNAIWTSLKDPSKLNRMATPRQHRLGRALSKTIEDFPERWELSAIEILGVVYSLALHIEHRMVVKFPSGVRVHTCENIWPGGPDET